MPSINGSTVTSGRHWQENSPSISFIFLFWSFLSLVRLRLVWCKSSKGSGQFEVCSVQELLYFENILLKYKITPFKLYQMLVLKKKAVVNLLITVNNGNWTEWIAICTEIIAWFQNRMIGVQLSPYFIHFEITPKYRTWSVQIFYWCSTEPVGN